MFSSKIILRVEGHLFKGVIQMGTFNVVIQWGLSDGDIQCGHSMGSFRWGHSMWSFNGVIQMGIFKAVSGGNLKGSSTGVLLGVHSKQSFIRIIGRSQSEGSFRVDTIKAVIHFNLGMKFLSAFHIKTMNFKLSLRCS